ncbi:oxidative stress-responsive serine-rich protein 1 isoform X1 [Brachyistius frenatus]|uniref:oxidative stress-responsive serine-rich protein 1 isoform X1 n=2 Tax=Brachyistius frenatus TaxID=100188 RepID=UPI0037E82839
MEAGGKDCEEETLQTAFKKLRVDAESLPGAVSVSEALTPRAAASRACLETSGAKPKLSCPKDNWHGCMRKTSRGASRTQRRRRSKSPILHPPKFTYCSTAAASALSPPSGCLKHQRLAVLETAEPRPAGDGATSSSAAGPAQKELSSSGTAGHISPLVFGSCAGYETRIGGVVSPPSLQEIPAVMAAAGATSSGPEGGSSGDVRSSEDSGPEKSACDGAQSGPGAPLRSGSAEAADFRALSELHSSGAADGPCVACAQSSGTEEGGQGAEPPCPCRSNHQGWHGVEVYSFTGLRNVISDCERSLPGREDTSRTLSGSAPSSGSPRSCSEQARAYVDDITIEDLSGYMEYYLYIPKKMSHMAEMMYT